MKFNLKNAIYKDERDYNNLNDFLYNVSEIYYSNFKNCNTDYETSIMFDKLHKNIKEYLFNGYNMFNPIIQFTIDYNELTKQNIQPSYILEKLTNQLVYDLQESNMLF